MGLGTGVDFSRLASACRGHFVGVCLHGASVDTVALAVVVVVRRLFIFRGDARLSARGDAERVRASGTCCGCSHGRRDDP